MTHSQLVVLEDAFGEPQASQLFETIVAYPEFLKTLGPRRELVERLRCLDIDLIIVQEQFLQLGSIEQGFQNEVYALVADPVHLQADCVYVLLLGKKSAEVLDWLIVKLVIIEIQFLDARAVHERGGHGLECGVAHSIVLEG